MSNVLQTAREVVDALGGPTKASQRLGRTTSAATNWKAAGKLPAELYVLINSLLGQQGKSAPPFLFGMPDGINPDDLPERQREKT